MPMHFLTQISLTNTLLLESNDAKSIKPLNPPIQEITTKNSSVNIRITENQTLHKTNTKDRKEKTLVPTR